MANFKKTITYAIIVLLTVTNAVLAEELPIIRMAQTKEIPNPLAGLAALFSPQAGLMSQAGKRPIVVRSLELEEYTRGVAQREMGPTWPIEALKAQAILARTNAIYAYLRNKDKPYHLTQESPQTYGPQGGGYFSSTTQAARQTHGLIINIRGAISPVFFHAVCGGATELASNVWPTATYYPAAVTCGYCTQAPSHQWKSEIPVREVQDKLAQAGWHVPHLKAITADTFSDVSDRITHVIAHHGRGTTRIPANTLRIVLGHNKVRSTNFTVSRENDTFLITGRGWGHGVGMCQWGARQMAKQGKNFREILEHYYPQVQIARIKS